MKTIAAIALIACLSGCTFHIGVSRSLPTVQEDAISDAGIIGEADSGGLIVNDAAYARYCALMGQFSDKLVPTIQQHDGTTQGAARAAKGNTWTISREGVALWRVMQRWERAQK